jgi:hypothetical protein
MADYTLKLDSPDIVKAVRQSIGDPGFDIIDDELIINDLEDAFDFVCMVSADELEMRYVRRCTIRLAAYISYKNYTTLAERRLSTLPESAPMLLQTLLMQAYNCLSYITQVPLNTDLSVNLNALGSPIAGQMSPTLIEQ